MGSHLTSDIKWQVLRFADANCKNCYKCVRACPVKAISILDDKAEINDARCVFCGKCFLACPQDAGIHSTDKDKVRELLDSDSKVYVSLAATYSMYFGNYNLRNMAYALKQMGFFHVEETAVGTGRVLQEYEKIINSQKYSNLITSHCPGSNYLIQKYHPKLLHNLFPVVTPLEAHALMMRKAYGDDIKIVGIGPCLAYLRLIHSEDCSGGIDAYITYEELKDLMDEEGVTISPEQEDEDTYAVSAYRNRYTDETTGVFRAMDIDIKKKYMLWTADGVTKLGDVMQGLGRNISGHIVEALTCTNGCLGAPTLRMEKLDKFDARTRWLEGIKENINHLDKRNPSEEVEVELRKAYRRMEFPAPEPTEDDIEMLLELIDKRSKKDMLDCSGCGYPSCRDKAIAVYQGMADPYMCIPHSRDIAEAQSNLMFDNVPTGCLVLDGDLVIRDSNKMAEQLLDRSGEELQGTAASDFLPQDFLESSKLKESAVFKKALKCPAIDCTVNATFFKARRDVFMVLLEDVTERAELIEKAARMRLETIDITKDVVEKQMRVAQEIASLLGETTAETKLAFNRLRDNLLESESEWK